MPRFRSLAIALAALLAFALVGAACGDERGVRLTLVAYSTPREAYEEIVAAFQRTPAGTGITFDQSYGASGEQSRAVAAGLPADLVALSLEPDVTSLVEAGRVDRAWNTEPYHGMVTDSVVVLVVREGNPKGIRGWDDLLKPGVEVIAPNPFTSGGARWNVMGGYGAQLQQGRSAELAAQYLRDLYTHVTVQDKSAREALQTFSGGKGDVLISYENEAIFARQKGTPLDYVLPDQTILIENPVAIVKDTKYPRQAQAFLDFLRSEEAQTIFAAKGYRPVQAETLARAGFPMPARLFTVADLGGWERVEVALFKQGSGVLSDIQRGSFGSR